MKAKHLLVVAAVAVCLLALRLLLVGPEERLRRELLGLADEASKWSDERPLAAAATARSISKRFAVEAEALDVATGRTARGRDAIAQAVGWARESWERGEVRFESLEIVLQGDARARASGRVRILGEDGQGVSPYDGTRVRFDWIKLGGRWEIERAEAEVPSQ